MTTQPKTTEAENPYLTREDALAILNTPDDQLDELIARAEKLRRKYKGDNVGIHILTNARSGNCSQDCAYCAQSCRSTADIEKYKWVSDEKLYKDNDFVNEHHLSRHCIGLSGMKFTDEEIEELAERIRAMKKTGTHLCCSIGFLTEKQARTLYDAGLDRINHNLNSSRAYYSHICSTHTFDQRVENIHMLQKIGFEICSGGIIGMGESKEDKQCHSGYNTRWFVCIRFPVNLCYTVQNNFVPLFCNFNKSAIKVVDFIQKYTRACVLFL